MSGDIIIHCFVSWCRSDGGITPWSWRKRAQQRVCTFRPPAPPHLLLKESLTPVWGSNSWHWDQGLYALLAEPARCLSLSFFFLIEDFLMLIRILMIRARGALWNHLDDLQLRESISSIVLQFNVIWLFLETFALCLGGEKYVLFRTCLEHWQYRNDLSLVNHPLSSQALSHLSVPIQLPFT